MTQSHADGEERCPVTEGINAVVNLAGDAGYSAEYVSHVLASYIVAIIHHAAGKESASKQDELLAGILQTMPKLLAVYQSRVEPRV